MAALEGCGPSARAVALPEIGFRFRNFERQVGTADLDGSLCSHLRVTENKSRLTTSFVRYFRLIQVTIGIAGSAQPMPAIT